MGTQYLIDTNVVIEFLGGVLPDVASARLQRAVEDQVCYLSVINRIELLGFPGPESEMGILADFIAACHVLPLSEAIAEQTIALRRSQRIKLPDALIAATALTHTLTLLTRNLADFARIEGLDCLNPHEQMEGWPP